VLAGFLDPLPVRAQPARQGRLTRDRLAQAGLPEAWVAGGRRARAWLAQGRRAPGGLAQACLAQ
jgi:hypothetical protein